MKADSHGSDDRDHLRQHLQTRRREVIDDLQRCLIRMREVDGRTAATENVEEDASDIDVGLIDIMNATVTRIDAALERLADGGYGLCARCHRPIAEARLRALPFAVCCRSCETAREHDAVRRAGVRQPPWDEERVTMWAREEG